MGIREQHVPGAVDCNCDIAISLDALLRFISIQTSTGSSRPACELLAPLWDRLSSEI